MLITADQKSKIISMMSDGYTPTQVLATIGISKKTFERIIDLPENADVKEAFELGLTMFEAKMESMGMGLIDGSISGKESTWYRFMQKYFNWNDKSEVKTVDDSIKYRSDDELHAEIDKYLNNKKTS